jgi:hypothetical protein
MSNIVPVKMQTRNSKEFGSNHSQVIVSTE